MDLIPKVVMVAILYSLSTLTNCTPRGWQSPKNFPGPKKSDRIAIVGAGAAGVHMALELKKRGFMNVKILEASCRVGGKTLTIYRRGAQHDLGAIFLFSNYVDNVMKLAKEFNYSKIIPSMGSNVWATPINRPQSFNSYFINEMLIATGINDPVQVAAKLVWTFWRYLDLHQRMFGHFPFALMPRPNATILERIRGTALEFLHREDLLLLAPFFDQVLTIYGYDGVDSLAALYLLVQSPPIIVKGFISYICGLHFPDAFIFKDGFQGLWKKIVKDAKLQISFGREVVKLKRHGKKVYIRTMDKVASCRRNKGRKFRTPWRDFGKGGLPEQRQDNLKRLHNKPCVCKCLGQYYSQPICPVNQFSKRKYSHYKKRGLLKTEVYDFVMWTPEMKQSLNVIDATPLETRLFSPTIPQYLTSTMLDEIGGIRSTLPADAFLNNIRTTTNEVFAQQDIYSMLHFKHGSNYQQGNEITGNDNKRKLRTLVVYQLDLVPPCPLELQSKLERHYRDIFAKFRMIYRKTWRYFPRYSPKDIQTGVLWDIVEAQGQKRMWYLGSSVSFESVRSVIEYNRLILSLTTFS